MLTIPKVTIILRTSRTPLLTDRRKRGRKVVGLCRKGLIEREINKKKLDFTSVLPVPLITMGQLKPTEKHDMETTKRI